LKNYQNRPWKNFFIHLLPSVCLGLLITFLPDTLMAKIDVRDAMVKIYSVQNQPDYNNPWNMNGPKASSGSGCVISGNRILTNAHVVRHQTFVQVRLYGQSKKYNAKVMVVSHDADLALLTVENHQFFQNIKPLEFAELPESQQEVVVYGFPEGGDTLSTTKGVISRTEHHMYAHSLMNLLATQLDAAINPGNSGGPVIIGDRIVGVVMEIRRDSENIGYMVPVPIVKHFLDDISDGRYDGFPDDGIVVQNMENEGLRRRYGLFDGQSGALVVSTVPGTPAEGTVFPGDVILSIDGHRVEDDCTVEFRPNERTSFKFYIQQQQIGEDLNIKILRSGSQATIKLTLDKAWGTNRLVPMMRYDVSPTYYVYGGLVFCPLTLNYILAMDGDWNDWRLSNVLNYFANKRLSKEGEQVVIITKVLPSDINNGYQNFINDRVVEVNGKEILNLLDLIAIIERNADEAFVNLKTESGRMMALDRGQAEKEQSDILRTYRISADRSSNLNITLSTGEGQRHDDSRGPVARENGNHRGGG
jgi:S1-C subfamily serine protease